MSETPPRVDFPSTHWSMVAGLADPDDPAFRRHLSALVERYWKAAWSFLARLPAVPPGRALDVAQEFFASLLEKGRLGEYSPERGSFRAYLKSALRRFGISARRAERAPAFRLDATGLEPPDPSLSPEAAFDRAWAQGVIAETVADLQRHLAREWKSIYFDLFREYYLEPSGLAVRRETAAEMVDPTAVPVSYETLAARHRIAPHDVANHLRHARQVFVRLLQARAQEYLGPGVDAADELRFLLARE